MLLLIIVALKFLTEAEGRVFCQDLHATAWKPLGFSCPMTCRTILSAVDRLKQIDYQNLVNLQTVKALKLPKTATKRRRKPTRIRSLYKRVHDTAEGKYTQTYKAYAKIIQTEQFFADFKIELQNLTAVLNITCYIAANRTRLLRQVLNDCTVNQTKGYILRSFREFLNKYADPDHRFDTGMTLIVLKHLLSNSNFRYGMMEAILVYLKRALKPEERGLTLGKEETIHLTSRHCLSMFVSGCYCHKGYVEQQGLCMKPENCSKDPIFVAYLHRVEIN